MLRFPYRQVECTCTLYLAVVASFYHVRARSYTLVIDLPLPTWSDTRHLYHMKYQNSIER